MIVEARQVVDLRVVPPNPGRPTCPPWVDGASDSKTTALADGSRHMKLTVPSVMALMLVVPRMIPLTFASFRVPRSEIGEWYCTLRVASTFLSRTRTDSP